ncbi:diacylglycerol kinase [Actinomadura barringtoniae]|uniref:Diacylglycerol kinase n=1 Tax=Actinomadura barringtoniae TaxID=1427535 RepID=A0A939TDK4_9ACTN|nr:diacylglycerol kinase [Actinomadura barringtoniae]MBO2455692.1 diacylglycerol kinase [Actinomadura barringtoniae]
MSYRVGQWATGNVGRQALRAIIEHPDLELIGVVVSDPAKVGVDAGELAGLDQRVGVAATDDPARLIEAEPDVVGYTAVGTSGRKEVATGERPRGAVDDLCLLLEAGISVVSTALIPLVHPGSADPGDVRRLEEACETGGAALLTTGLDPGLMNDVLPLLLSGVCLRIDAVKVSEVMSYGLWDKPEAIVGKFGFGKPLDHRPPILQPGVLTLMWGSIVHLMAEQLDVTLDEVTESYELCPAPERFEIPAGVIEKGMSAGMRFQVTGVVNGRPAIVVEHVTRLREDVGLPHWPEPPFGQAGGYRVEIDGEPPWRLDIANPGAADPTVPGTLATALRVVNAIPAVAEAPPGLHTPFTLPHITGRHLMR